MKKLRICMICSEFPPSCAGIGKRVYSLSKTLIKQGHLVTVLTRGKFFRETKIRIEGINVIELPFIAFPPPLHLVYHGYFVNKKLREMQNDFDVIHLHTPLVPKITVSLPKVVQVHSLWMEEIKYFKDAKDTYSLAVRMFKNQVINSEKVTLDQANAVIIYSEHENKLLQLYKINLPKLHIINGAVDSESASLKKITKKYDVVFVGRLNPRKGVKEIMQAASLIAKEIPSVKFLIIGNGNSRNWMEAQVERNKLQNNFTFLGFIPNKKVTSFLIQSRISIVPSRYEPFGIVTGEAMAVGLPVVGTKVGGIKSMVLDGVTGYLVNVGDYKLLAKKVVYLLQHPEKAVQMGCSGKIRISKYFNEDVIVAQFESAYKEII